MSNSLRKGKAFEREIAKLLTKTFKVKFYRVPMSGAFQTQKNTRNPVFKGDVFTEDKKWNKRFNTIIECKRVKRLPRLDLNDYKSGFDFLSKNLIHKWIEQCIFEAGRKNFWLIMKEDYKPPIIIRGYNHKGVFILTLPDNLKDYLERIVR